MDIVNELLGGFATALSGTNLLYCFVGVLLGTVVGILPGLGGVTTMVLLLPLTYTMDSATALIMLAGVYYGSMYGGSTTAILMNMPGESPAVVTTFDGYKMAKKGRAGAALAISAYGSFVAGTIGVVGIMLFSPVLAKAALAFGPPEFFAISVLGFVLLSNLTGKSFLRSLLMVLVGIMLGTIGIDPIEGYMRFTLRITELSRGVEMSVITIAVFGLAEILLTAMERYDPASMIKVKVREMYPNKEEMKRSVAPILRGSLLGFFIGLIPGPAAIMSTLGSYAVEKKLSKHPEEFGQGAIEGVAGPESANNAASSGAFVPLLALGLPFAPAAAILLSGLTIQGITPGPLFITQNPVLFWGLIASMYVGNVMLLVLNLPMVPAFASLVKIPPKKLLPIVTVITFCGAFSMNNSTFDLWLLIIFALVGLLMKRAGFDAAPLIVGLVLGPEMEAALRRGLIMGDGSFAYFLSRPIACAILSFALLYLLYALISKRAKRHRATSTSS